MRAVGVVVLDAFDEYRLEMAAAEDEHPVKALSPNGANCSLADGVTPCAGKTAMADPSIASPRSIACVLGRAGGENGFAEGLDSPIHGRNS
jgi:hypothetical protein